MGKFLVYERVLLSAVERYLGMGNPSQQVQDGIPLSKWNIHFESVDSLSEHRDPDCNTQLQTSFSKGKASFMNHILNPLQQWNVYTVALYCSQFADDNIII